MSPVQSLAGATCIKRDTDAGVAGAGAAAADDDDDVSSSINQQSYFLKIICCSVRQH